MPRYSLKDAEAARFEDPARMHATTEDDIRRHIEEDGGIDLGEVNDLAWRICRNTPTS